MISRDSTGTLTVTPPESPTNTDDYRRKILEYARNITERELKLENAIKDLEIREELLNKKCKELGITK
jgi:RNA polymerase-interacting CarD/CdnL/TRCF family regulator